MTQLRIQKYLSQAWVCSRRKAEEYIEKWLIFVDNKKATIGQVIDTEINKVTLKDQIIEESKKLVYYKLNKPYGIVSTCKRDWENSILDIMEVPERVFPIWRLDKNSTGLILLTNDGRLSNYLIHPRYEHEKEYIVEVYGKITDEALDKISKWMYILWKKTKTATIKRVGSDAFSIILKEWMNRQIRRMVEKTGFQVKKLKRIRVENILLWKLQEWEYQKLTQKETQCLMQKLSLLSENFLNK